ncbi:MAG: glycerophosphodiester phosphodiesterase [Gaiellaceae bacterium]
MVDRPDDHLVRRGGRQAGRGLPSHPTRRTVISLERRDGKPLRIGHRGAAALAPENTLRSFRAAVEAGVDLIEFDVLALRGGELIVAHSNDLHEVSRGAARGTIAALTLDRLREVSPELPTLDDALAFFAEEARDVGVHVDLKSAGAAPAVAAALSRFGLLERSFVSSFHVRALRRLADVEPRVRLGVSFPRDMLRMDKRRGFGPVVGVGLHGLRRVTPGLVRSLLWRSSTTALVLHHTLASAATVRRAHAHGAAVVAWTVDDLRDLERVDDAGVDAVVTNDPSIFLSTLTT